MVSGPSGRDQDSQNQLFLFFETPRHFKEDKQYRICLGNTIFENIRMLGIGNFENFGTGRERRIPKIHQITFLNFEYGINVFQKT